MEGKKPAEGDLQEREGCEWTALDRRAPRSRQCRGGERRESGHWDDSRYDPAFERELQPHELPSLVRRGSRSSAERNGLLQRCLFLHLTAN